jgi:hypothetical protein
MAADAQFSLQRDNELRFETSQRHIAIKNEEKKSYVKDFCVSDFARSKMSEVKLSRSILT